MVEYYKSANICFQGASSFLLWWRYGETDSPAAAVPALQCKYLLDAIFVGNDEGALTNVPSNK